MVFNEIIGGSLLGGGPTPEPNIVGISPGTERLVDSKYDQAMEDPKQRQEETFKNIDNSGIYEKQFGLLGGMGDAIKQKYGQILKSNIDDLKANSALNLRKDQSNRYKMAQQALLAKQQATNEAFARQMEAYNARESARAQAIGSIIGAGAMFGGFALAGPGVAANQMTRPAPMASPGMGPSTQHAGSLYDYSNQFKGREREYA